MYEARKRGKKIGRPSKLTPKQVEWAREQLLAANDPHQEVKELSRKLRVSPKTLGRSVNEKVAWFC